MERRGKKSVAQTPAPKKDRIYGSERNPKGSASSSKSASKIELSESIINTLENKRDEYNAKHPNGKVTLATLKAVFRRGAGAYSSSHRPTITGGRPNSRSAWAFARVNKFLLKKGGTKVKAAYVQDDDLMERGGIIAPNGKKSNLTPEQYKLVRTPQFKAWFGDWENDPQNASKVVDENGEPLVVYHGGRDFNYFDAEKIGTTTDKGWYGYGFYFSPSEEVSNLYGGSKAFFIKIKNIFNCNKNNPFYGATKEVTEYYVDQGYDGSSKTFDVNKKGHEYCVFFKFPNNIKLADGSNTTFIANNPDIRYDDGGLVNALTTGMENINKNGIVLSDNRGDITVIAYNTENKEVSPSLYNKSLIYKSVQPIKSSNEIMQNFDLQDFERFKESKIKDYKKSHLIVLNQNEVVYDSNVYAEGGDMGQEITCVNCGWHWNTNQSDEFDKYVCHKCGFDNRTFYDSDPIGKYHLGGDMSKHLAPNGKPSNLNHEQWHLVRTPEFKEWFGDWESDPENASKVVDENGEPKVMYHGSRGDFNIFSNENPNKLAWTEGGLGFYFTTYSDSALGYGRRIIPSFINSRKIKKSDESEHAFVTNNQLNKLYQEGYDSIYFDGQFTKTNGQRGWKEDELVVFEPNQIKLADGTNTTFDANNPDIRYKNGGNIENEFDELDNDQLVKILKSFYSDLSESPIFEYLDLKEGDYTLNIGDNELVIFKKKPFSKIESIKIGRFIQPYFDASKKPLFARFFDSYTVSGNNIIIKVKDMYENGGIIDETYNKVLQGSINSDDGAIYLYENGIEVTDDIYDRLRDAEQLSIKKGRGLQVGDMITIKGKYGNADFKGNFRGYTNEGKLIVVYEGGKQMAINKDEYYKDGGQLTDSQTGALKFLNNPNTYAWSVNIGGATTHSLQIGIPTRGGKTQNIKGQVFKSLLENKFIEGIDKKSLGITDRIAIYKISEKGQEQLSEYKDGGLLKKAPSVLKIADKHNVDLETVDNALKNGIKVEMEHTKNKNVAKTIALHHLYESPKYYEKLKEMEKELNLDEHYEDIKKIYNIGGVVDPVLSFSTPTGEPSKLTYLQQVLVRTNAFKKFFGDWEYAGNQFVKNGRQEYEYLYRNVSKVIDKITLEPKVVYHGTRVDSEFFVFDVSQQSGIGRPYGYFAHNIEYSQNFTSPQLGITNGQPFLYKCFVNIRNPFYAMTSEYYDIQEDAQYWKNEISKTIALDKYTNELDANKLKTIKDVVESQIGKYIDDTFRSAEMSFWVLMARDNKKLFKYFLNNYRYDGVFYAEEFSNNYDVDNPAEFTEAVTIFEPSQVKLADGRNLNFDPMNVDIRYEKGGDTNNVENTQEKYNVMGKRENLRNLLLGDKYAEGGEVVANKLKDGNDGKKGGYFEGRSHAEGGIKAYNKDTGQMIEVEGEEVIITKGAVKDEQKREFEGEMLTNREILSRINQSGGGVSFEKGGEMGGSSCGCSGKKYKYGGEMMDDYSIVKIMNRPFEIINDNFADARAFADMLVNKLK